MKKFYTLLTIFNLLSVSTGYALVGEIVESTVDTAGNIAKGAVQGAAKITETTVRTPERVITKEGTVGRPGRIIRGEDRTTVYKQDAGEKYYAQSEEYYEDKKPAEYVAERGVARRTGRRTARRTSRR